MSIRPENAREDTLRAIQHASRHANDYVATIFSRRVAPSAEALENLSQLNEPVPDGSSDAGVVLDRLHTFGSPATMATTGGRFFGLVVGGSTPAAMGAAMLAAAWDQTAFSDVIAPSAVHLERIAGHWLLELLSLPETSSVSFTTGAATANLLGLAAARDSQYRKLGVDLAEVGLAGAPPLRVWVSAQAHVTIVKALSVLGIGKGQITRLPCDAQGRVIPEGVPMAGPDTIVCLQAGNVNSGHSDPFAALVPSLRSAGAWVHVDGAFGLWAAAAPSTRGYVEGVELADSWAVDAHKWLNTPYDCGVAICRDPRAVQAIMSTQASYLAETTVSPKDTVLEFSRRARGVEVWAAIKAMGRKEVGRLVERCCAHARRLAAGLAELGYEILNEVVLNQVVAAIGTKEETEQMTRLVQQEGVCWFGTTLWQGRYAIRLSVSSWATTTQDIEETLAAIARATAQALKRR